MEIVKMRSFLLPFTTFVFLFSSTVFGEEVKDVGLVCTANGKEMPTHSSYWFKDGQTVEWYFRDIDDSDNDGDTIEYSYDSFFSERMKYRSSDHHITISHYSDGKPINGWYERIDRFTLKLEENFYDTKTPYDCEAYSSKDEFLSEVKNTEADLRAFLKKRKI